MPISQCEIRYFTMRKIAPVPLKRIGAYQGMGKLADGAMGLCARENGMLRKRDKLAILPQSNAPNSQAIHSGNRMFSHGENKTLASRVIIKTATNQNERVTP